MTNAQSKWKQITLGEVTDIAIGRTPPRMEVEWFSDDKNDHVWVSIKDMGAVARFIDDSSEYLTDVAVHRFRIPQIKKGSILLSFKLTVGRVAIARRDMFSNEAIAQIRIKDSAIIDRDFLYYFLKNFNYNSLGSTSSIAQAVNSETIKNLPLSIPDITLQKSIAAVLSSLDDKIELLRAQNKTLEEMAQRLFKEWFVDFNFPNEDGKPYKKSGGRMLESEMGEIPEGWRVGTLGDEFDISIGRTPPRNEAEWFSNTPIGKKWISIRDIVNSGTYIFHTSEYLTDEAIIKFNIPVIPKNTTIISFKMTVGKLAITTEEMLSNEAIAHLKIKVDSKLTSEFIYSCLQHLDFNSLGSTSSIVVAINSTIIKKIPVIVPNELVLSRFDEVTKNLFEKIFNNSCQMQPLLKLRDKLLPKLMSGEIRL